MSARTLLVASALFAGAAVSVAPRAFAGGPGIDLPVYAVVFTGTVTNGGQPVAGATVRIAPWGVEGRTDRAGAYSITVAEARIGDGAVIRVSGAGVTEAVRSLTIGQTSVRLDLDLGAPAEEAEAVLLPEARQNQASDAKTAGQSRPGRSMEQVARLVAPAFAPSVVSSDAACCRRADPDDFNTESYAAIDENPFVGAKSNPLSTFSIDVDRASYANVRRFLREGRMPPRDAVRIEELINYFPYEDAAPTGRGAPFAVTTELAPAPWRPEHKLLRVALKARSIDTENIPASNLVFLLDVSGSMNSPDKLPLLKQAFGLLANEMRPEDRVAIVVYAGAAGLVLESTPGSRKDVILEAIERLEAGGSTAGGAGIRLAYDVARRNFIAGGNNRVILATDGDFNVGASSDAEMMRLIEDKRRGGTFLTVLGFGSGNLKDSKMESIADHGNGNYAYIDNLMEARKVLIEEMGGTLHAVAKDVKIQVEFNPATVRGYRLIGYENRLLAAEDFNDDRKDAGELGAGHSVTALYEVVPVGANSDVEIRGVDALRYQDAADGRGGRGELGHVKLRWKEPSGETSTLMEHPVRMADTRPSDDFRFSGAVAAFGMLLRESENGGNASYERVLAWAKEGLGDDRGGYRAAFIELVGQARRIAGAVADVDGPSH